MLERERVLVRSNIVTDTRDEADMKDAKTTGKFSELHCREFIANAPPVSQASTPSHMTSRPDLTGNPFSTPPFSLGTNTPENEELRLSIPRFPTPPKSGRRPLGDSKMGWRTQC